MWRSFANQAPFQVSNTGFPRGFFDSAQNFYKHRSGATALASEDICQWTIANHRHFSWCQLEHLNCLLEASSTRLLRISDYRHLQDRFDLFEVYRVFVIAQNHHLKMRSGFDQPGVYFVSQAR